MSRYGALREELTNDPLAIGYSGMDDATAAASLNDETARPAPDRDSLSSAEIYNVIDRTEYLALTTAEQDELKVILGLGERVDITAGSKARGALAAMFDAASVTRAALLGLVENRTQSRAQELSLGTVDAELVGATR